MARRRPICIYELAYYFEDERRVFTCETSRPIYYPEDVEALTAHVLGPAAIHMVPEFKLISDKPKANYSKLRFKVLTCKSKSSQEMESPATAAQYSEEAQANERELRLKAAANYFDRFRHDFMVSTLGFGPDMTQSLWLQAPKAIRAELLQLMSAVASKCLACVIGAFALAPVASGIGYACGITGEISTLFLMYAGMGFTGFMCVSAALRLKRIMQLARQQTTQQIDLDLELKM